MSLELDSGMAGGPIYRGNHMSATVKRRKKSAAMPHPKKMFEEAQMVRRVKAYLSNMKVLPDEEQLRQMSLEVEPPVGGSQQLTATNSTSGSTAGSESRATGAAVLNAAVQVRKRHPSPTLSTASTASSTSAASEGRKSQQLGPKFGEGLAFNSQSFSLSIPLLSV